MTTDSTGDAKNELVLRPYTYNSTVWSNAAQTTFVKAWADPSLMRQTSIDFAAEMNKDIAAENN
jgi:multiple sugar transport system substrate-binding protein